MAVRNFDVVLKSKHIEGWLSNFMVPSFDIACFIFKKLVVKRELASEIDNFAYKKLDAEGFTSNSEG